MGALRTKSGNCCTKHNKLLCYAWRSAIQAPRCPCFSGRKYSHRRHHSNTGSMERDEVNGVSIIMSSGLWAPLDILKIRIVTG